MAKPNFQFQKRQKELERKKKQEEKLQRKVDKQGSSAEEDLVQSAEEAPPRAVEMPTLRLSVSPVSMIP